LPNEKVSCAKAKEASKQTNKQKQKKRLVLKEEKFSKKYKQTSISFTFEA